MAVPRRRSVNAEGAQSERLAEVGARIAEARRELGIDQKELASLVHVSDKAVSLWERGKTSPHRHIKDLAAVLSRPEAWFWNGDAPEEASHKLLEHQTRLLQSILDELRLQRLARDE